jgi:hypothetical protein
MMGTRAGFNANQTGWQGREELQHLRAADPLADHHCPINIHAVDLKYRLRNIKTDCANLAHGRLPSSGSFRRNHPMAVRQAGSAASKGRRIQLTGL